MSITKQGPLPHGRGSSMPVKLIRFWLDQSSFGVFNPLFPGIVPGPNSSDRSLGHPTWSLPLPVALHSIHLNADG